MCSERLHFQKLSFVANVAFLMILAWRSHDIFWLIKLRKSVRILSFSSLYFPALGLNTEKYRVSGKIQTRKTLNTDTFLAVHRLLKVKKILCRESHFYLLINHAILPTDFNWSNLDHGSMIFYVDFMLAFFIFVKAFDYFSAINTTLFFVFYTV